MIVEHPGFFGSDGIALVVDEVDSVLLLVRESGGPGAIVGSFDGGVGFAVCVAIAVVDEDMAGWPVDDGVELILGNLGVVEMGHGVEVASDDDRDIIVLCVREALGDFDADLLEVDRRCSARAEHRVVVVGVACALFPDFPVVREPDREHGDFCSVGEFDECADAFELFENGEVFDHGVSAEQRDIGAARVELVAEGFGNEFA